jgi:hypothetical protein
MGLARTTAAVVVTPRSFATSDSESPLSEIRWLFGLTRALKDGEQCGAWGFPHRNGSRAKVRKWVFALLMSCLSKKLTRLWALAARLHAE